MSSVNTGTSAAAVPAVVESFKPHVKTRVEECLPLFEPSRLLLHLFRGICICTWFSGPFNAGIGSDGVFLVTS